MTETVIKTPAVGDVIRVGGARVVVIGKAISDPRNVLSPFERDIYFGARRHPEAFRTCGWHVQDLTTGALDTIGTGKCEVEVGVSAVELGE